MQAFQDWPGLVCASCNIPFAVAINEVYTFQVDRLPVNHTRPSKNLFVTLAPDQGPVLRITEIWSGPLIICPVCQNMVVIREKLRGEYQADRHAFDQLRALIVKGDYLFFYRFNNSLDASLGMTRGMLSRDMLPVDVMKRFGFSEQEKNQNV